MIIVGKDHAFTENNRYFMVCFMRIHAEKEQIGYSQVIIMVYTTDGSFINFAKLAEIIAESVGSSCFVTGITEIKIEDAVQLHAIGEDYAFGNDNDKEDDTISEEDFENDML